MERDAPGVEQCEHQVRRIMQSAAFRNATTLQQLFQFLAAKMIAGEPDALKEYTIGVEALGRRQDFDPKTDPIVRVQSHRLRLKLKEYYDFEGRHDPVLIQIPKGHYVPTFETAPLLIPDLDHGFAPDLAAGLSASSTDHEPKTESTEPGPRRIAWLFHRRTHSLIAMAAAAIALFVVAFWLGGRHARSDAGVDTANSNLALDSARAIDPVKAFWSGFLGNDSAPVIAYTDAVFLLDDSNDLFRYRHGASDSRGALVDSHLARKFASNPSLVAVAGQLYYENGYTGTGELESLGMLAGLLGRMGIKPTVKSSRDITPDDLKQHNVILLGSPFQNAAVAQLLTAGDFLYSNPDSRHEQWRAQIMNTHPRANEEPIYHTERDRTTQVLTADYSLITVAPSVVPGRFIAILGGLDTKGTEGATMFATSKLGIDQLTKAIAASSGQFPKDELPVFQALVHVKLAKGYQVLDAELIAVHRLHSVDPTQTDSSSATASVR
jgi:hypothetical protein